MITAQIRPKNNRGKHSLNIFCILAAVVICFGLVTSCNSGGNTNQHGIIYLTHI
jgi:hypothetical protein